MTADAAAPRLDWSSSKLSRIENGQQMIDVHGVRSMLDLYNVGGDRWGELIELTRQCRQRGWWRAYGLEDKGYVPLEAEACLVRDFTLAYVPGLLQTPEYAREIFRAGLERRTRQKVDNLVAVRLVRQRRLTSTDDPLELVAVLDEAVLHRQVGGPTVMRAQLARLVQTSELPTVTIHVLPNSLGAHPAMSSMFTVLSFGDLGVADMAYAEHAMGAVHLDKEADVARATLTFDRLRSLALTPAASVGLIQRAAGQQ